MDLNILFGIATLIALAIAVYEWNQNRLNTKKLSELEDGLILTSFKLKKAMEFYNKGEFKSSMEAFRAFSKESEDSSEMFEALRKIFWSETKKIFTQVTVSGWSPTMLITAIIVGKVSDEAEYDPFVLSLISLYEDSFGKKAHSFKSVVLLTNREYEHPDLEEAIAGLKVCNSKKTNASYRQFVNDYRFYMKSQA